MRTTRRLAFLLVLFLLTAAPIARAQQPVIPDTIAAARYFPLHVGNRWFYEGFHEQYERQILRDTTVNDTAYAVLWNWNYDDYSRQESQYLTLTRMDTSGVRYFREVNNSGTVGPEQLADPSLREDWRGMLQPVHVPLNAPINALIPMRSDVNGVIGFVHVNGALSKAPDGRMKSLKWFYSDYPESQVFSYMADIGEFAIGGSSLYNIPGAELVAYNVNGVRFGTFPTHGPTVTADSISAKRYFPLQVGNRWYFDSGFEHIDRRVLRDTTIHDTTYAVLWQSHYYYAGQPDRTTIRQVLTRIDSSGVRYERMLGAGGYGPEVLSSPSVNGYANRYPPVPISLESPFGQSFFYGLEPQGRITVVGNPYTLPDGRVRPLKGFSLNAPDVSGPAFVADLGEIGLGKQDPFIPMPVLKAYTVNGFTYGTFPTAVGDDRTRPEAFALLSAAPNPFNPSTQIGYQLPAAGHVRLEIFDALGRRIRTLVDETKPAGSHQAAFDGSGLPSGLYLARLSLADGRSLTRRLVLQK